MLVEEDHLWLSVIPAVRPGEAFLELKHSVVYNEDIPILKGIREDGWISDNVIAVAFELLGIWTSCNEKGVYLMNPTDARALCQIGIKDDQLSSHEDLSGLEKVRDSLMDKHWVFIPINDGYEQTFSDDEGFHGTHWCLLAIDLVLKKSYYIDSMATPLWKTAAYVDAGLQRLLGIREKFTYLKVKNTPKQGQQNDSATVDPGACGPFFYAVAATLVWHIICVEKNGRHWDLKMPGRPNQLRFDSFAVRNHLYRFMKLAKYVQTGDGWNPELADFMKGLSSFRTLCCLSD
ncbi:hypothetical protein BU16DRAFT_554621 [Lophium mytilinum]|uniref:Ubiquitin-like protease family profile domain-containing protein n=1 Tax=Lophium mytilinum TaxID=390894 RepID=A0A6A6RDT0_9PEZI|nr:hypothetical protein BU16DRAFT_554621 [Lophium mytilinum]